MRLQNNRGQYKLTISKDIALLKKWEQGSEITVFLDASSNILIKNLYGNKKKGRKKIQNNNGQFRITIPKSIVLLKKWRHGTQIIALIKENGDLILREIFEKEKNENTK